jgi:carboxymethylenebutenolidase
MVESVQLASRMNCLVARPETQEKRPAVMWLHERYGIVQHTHDQTQRLADSGFVGFAPDLFHRFTGDRDALVRADERCELQDETSLQDLEEAIAYMRSLPYVDGDRIGIVGVCQTGRQPLVYAAERTNLAAAVVFYGGVYPREWTADELRPKTIDAYLPHLSCPVMGLFGEADRLVPLAEIEQFRAYLEKHKKSYHIRIFADTPHGWLNDTMTDDRYRPEAAKEAWSLMVSFLNEVFSGKWDPSRVRWTFESDTSPDYGLAAG